METPRPPRRYAAALSAWPSSASPAAAPAPTAPATAPPWLPAHCQESGGFIVFEEWKISLISAPRTISRSPPPPSASRCSHLGAPLPNGHEPSEPSEAGAAERGTALAQPNWGSAEWRGTSSRDWPHHLLHRQPLLRQADIPGGSFAVTARSP